MGAAKNNIELKDPNARKSPSLKNLQKRLEEIMQDGSTDSRGRVSFGFLVLRCVVQGNYDRAKAELDEVSNGIPEYPEFKDRTERYIDHAKSLVEAIRTKREIGMSPHVNKSKQKELSDRIAEHFAELKKCIIIIEKIERSIRARDLSSTLYILKATFYSVVALFIAYFLIFVIPENSDLPLAYVKNFLWPE